MNDNVVSYTGSVENAETYFSEVFAEKYSNVNILGEGSIRLSQMPKIMNLRILCMMSLRKVRLQLSYDPLLI